MTYTKINRLWWDYHLTAGSTPHKEAALNKLLAAVRQRILYRFAKEEQDVEDIAQNVLLKVWKDLLANKFDAERGDFSAYLATVARTERLMFHRSDRMLACSREFIEEAQLNPALTLDAFLRRKQDPIKYMGE